MFYDDDEITLDPDDSPATDTDDAAEFELWTQARLQESAVRYLRLESLLDRFRAETGAPRPSGVAALRALETEYRISYDNRGSARVHARLTTTPATGD